MSAIADVARLAGVSKSTASRALSGRGYVSDATRARVTRAAAKIGYVVSSNAASLVTGETRNVGLVIPCLDRWYFSEVLEGVESALIAAGYDLTLYRLTSDEHQRRRIFDYFLVRKRVDAVIAVGIALASHEVEMLHALRKPIVGVGGDIEGITTMSIDDVSAARFITDHLINLGHTRILHLGGDEDHQMDFRVYEKRLRGVRAALEAEGIAHSDDFRAAPYSIQGGYHGAMSVLSDRATRPSAIVAGCDEIAIGAIIAARQLGIQVPTQLSVVGIDGHPLAEMFQLTTLEQYPATQGRTAVDLILSQLRGVPAPPEPQRIVLPVSMTVRSSTTAPAHRGTISPTALVH